MRTWTTAKKNQFCGGLHQQPTVIRKGDVMLVIEVPGLKRPLIRCAACAGPEPAESEPVSRPKLSFSSFSDVAADWKIKQAGS